MHDMLKFERKKTSLCRTGFTLSVWRSTSCCDSAGSVSQKGTLFWPMKRIAHADDLVTLYMSGSDLSRNRCLSLGCRVPDVSSTCLTRPLEGLLGVVINSDSNDSSNKKEQQTGVVKSLRDSLGLITSKEDRHLINSAQGT